MPLIRSHITHNHCSATFITGGTVFFDELIRIIQDSKYYLHIQFYIIENDETGIKIMRTLMQAANRGVKVFMLLDAYASADFIEKHRKELLQSGVFLRAYSRVQTFTFSLGMRMHQKIVLADGIQALVGGINIANKYSGLAGIVPWLDFAVKLKGPVVNDVEQICQKKWRRRIYRKYFKHLETNVSSSQGEATVRVLENNWLQRRFEISRAYRQAIRQSEKELVIVASYFLPGFTLRRLLKKASKRGVKIKFIFGKRSDVPIVLHASHFFYSFLLRNNMRIYEWKQSVVHGKLLFVDGISVNIGSYNLNALSDYGSLELNAEVNDTDFASQVNHELQSIMQQSSEVNPDYFNQLGAVQKIMHYISYRVIRMALAVLFFLMRKER